MYDKESKVLFIGDIVCFMGVPLPEDGLISEARDMREMWLEFIKSGQFSKALKSENIEIIDYIESIKSLVNIEIDYLCTGHGVVLKEDINTFLSKLIDEL